MKRVFIIFIICCLAALACWVAFNQIPTPIEKAAQAQRDLAQYVRGVSLLENLKATESLRIFDNLRIRDPQNAAILQNIAIGLLTRIDNLNAEISSSATTPQRATELRGEFPDLFKRLDDTVKRATVIEPDNVELARLSVIAQERRIALLPAAETKAAKVELIKQIKSDLQKFPGDVVLAAKLYNIAYSISLSDPKVMQSLAQPLQQAFEKNPRDAYLLKALAMLRIDAADLRAKELVEPAISIAKPQAWLMTLQNEGDDISESLQTASEKADGDPAAFFSTFFGWLNTFTSTSIYRSDAAATESISPLAMLRLDAMYAKLSDKNARAAQDIIQFDKIAIDERQAWRRQDLQIPREVYVDVIQSEWFDSNIDLLPELLIASEHQLALFDIPQIAEIPDPDDETITGTDPRRIEISDSIRTLCIADLFAAQADERQEIAVEKIQKRHSVTQDVVIGTDHGIQLATQRYSVEAPEKFYFNAIDGVTTGLPTQGNVTQIIPLDIEADGDLDLVCLIDQQVTIFANRGNRTFYDANEFSNMPDPSRKITSMLACDFDHDIDVDLLLSFEDGFGRLENIQHGQFAFKLMNEHWLELGNAQQLEYADFDGNVSWDFIAKIDDHLRLLRTTTLPDRTVRVIDHWSTKAVELKSFLIHDLDYDSHQDLIVVTNDGWRVLWQNNGEAFGFDKASALMQQADLRSVQVVALHGQQLAKVLAQSQQETAIWTPLKPARGGYINVRVKGIDDNASGRVNEYAIGTLLELYSPSAYQTRVIESPTTTFGIGDDSGKPYSLRIVFPNGLTQTVIDPQVDSVIEEKQELKGSCPFLYGWDGARWQLITDCLWNAPLGLQVARGKVLPGRRWEYLSLPRDFMQPINDAYELRLTEELWETAYIDQVELLVYDHPAKAFVLTNEKVGPDWIAKPSLWTYENTIAAPKVTDSSGRNWTADLAKQDGETTIAFDEVICQGLVSPHYVELALPTDNSLQNLQLILHGWIQPTDTSLNIGIAQNPNREGPIPPSLFALNNSGEERLLQDFMGFPGGKPKTIVIDLSSVLTKQDTALRIKTSAELYWDYAAFIQGTQVELNQAKPLKLKSAELHYRGFSELMPRRQNQPHWYDYDKLSTNAKWLPMSGTFTRYGGCESIVSKDDDQLVVMGSGDEMSLRFMLPTDDAPDGYVRDFILHNVGWDKDADLNTITGQTSLPLPFAAMKAYPAATSQHAEAQRVEQQNADTLTRQQSAINFWHQHN